MSAAARAATFALLTGLWLATTGCNAARAFIATPNDYADYRRVRLAATLEDRLAAASAYLEARPEGRYAERLRTYLDAVEPLFFRASSRSTVGLESYLRALPRGPHAKEAMERLIDARNLARREDLDERAARATLLRVSTESRSRQVAATTVDGWIRPMLSPGPWFGTFSDAPAEVLARFRMSAPEPVCVREGEHDVCAKDVVRAFRIRGQEGEVERELSVKVEVRLSPGHRLVGLSLTGVGVARATLEASSGVVVDGDDASAWHAFVDGLTKRIVEDGRACTGGEDATGQLLLDCDEARVMLRATRDAEGVERLSLERRSGAR